MRRTLINSLGRGLLSTTPEWCSRQISCSAHAAKKKRMWPPGRWEDALKEWEVLQDSIEQYNKEFKEEHAEDFKVRKPAPDDEAGPSAEEASTSGKSTKGTGKGTGKDPLADMWAEFQAGGGFEGSEEHLRKFRQPNEGEVGMGQLTQEDWDTWERARERAKDAFTEHITDTTPRHPVLNLAGKSRPGWTNLWHDEDTHQAMWALDMTAGRVPENEKNALLCRGSKELMCLMHMQGLSVPFIATYFKVRQQRVMAILALSQIEGQMADEGYPMHDFYAQLMEGGDAIRGDGTDGFEGVHPCDEVVGTGERHVKLLPRAPHYERKVGKDGKETIVDVDARERELEAIEDAQMIEEFKARLDYNMGQAGQKLRRNLNKSHRPRRPKDGYSLVVTPTRGKKFVAKPDGKVRGLNEDEEVLQEHQKIRPRRRLSAA